MTLQMFADVKGRFGGMKVCALPLYMHRKLCGTRSAQVGSKGDKGNVGGRTWRNDRNHGKSGRAENPVLGIDMAILEISP